MANQVYTSAGKDLKYLMTLKRVLGNRNVNKCTVVLQLHWTGQLVRPCGQAALPYIYEMFVS